MADLARTVKGRMIISVNDIPEMRQAFDGLTIERVDINYTVGGAGRSKTRSGELIIRQDADPDPLSGIAPCIANQVIDGSCQQDGIPTPVLGGCR